MSGKTVPQRYTTKMAVSVSIAEELLHEIHAFEPTKVARHIPRSMTISLDYFECSGLAQEYFLDLNEVYLKPKRKNTKIRVPNPDHIYEVFGKYSHESPDVVRTSIMDFVTCDPESFKERLVVVFSMLHHNLNSWLLKTKNRANPADEASLYGLCHLYSRHALVYTTGSIWSSLEWRGKYSVEDIKKNCDIHLVFLDGGILGQLHRKPQVPRLISATAPKALPLSIQDASNIVVISSESDPENKGRPTNNKCDTLTSPGKDQDDHSYASPVPQKRAEIAQMKTVESMQPNDHNYIELSDIPTEDDIRDEIITTGGKVILSKSDQVEISLEYQCNETLIEATKEQTESMESTGVNKNRSSLPPILQESTVNNELLEATTRTVPDETTNHTNPEVQCSQARNESDNGIVGNPPDSETQPSISQAQIKLDTTESMDTLPAPEQKIKSNANDSKDTVQALPAATPTDDSCKTIQGKENLKRQNLKVCIIQLTKLSKAERARWLPESEKAPANTDNKVYEMCNRNKNINRRYSSRKRKSVNYTDQTKDNEQDSDYEPKIPPPPPLDNKKYPSAHRMAIQQGILSNKTSKTENVATLPDVSKENLVGSQITRPTNGNTLDFPKEKVDVSPCPDVGKLANETETPTTSDSSSLPPKSDMLESDKNIKGVFKTKTISIRGARDPRSFKCSECDERTNTLRELNAHYIANHRKVECDICDKSFNTPGALRKHRYTHVEEKSQYRCRTCSKIFPFESQLKSHHHVHRHNCNYICASVNCGKSFKHPGDLAAHAKSHGEQHKCAHCNYSHSDIRNLKSHLRTHSRNAPFTCKLCEARFVHSNQLVRHHPKCPKVLTKTDTEAE